MKNQIISLFAATTILSSMNIFAYTPSNITYMLYEEHRNMKNIEKSILVIIYGYFIETSDIEKNHTHFEIKSSIETLELIKKNHYFRNIFEKIKYISEKKYIEINDSQYVFSEDQIQFINNIIHYFE